MRLEKNSKVELTRDDDQGKSFDLTIMVGRLGFGTWKAAPEIAYLKNLTEGDYQDQGEETSINSREHPADVLVLLAGLHPGTAVVGKTEAAQLQEPEVKGGSYTVNSVS